MIKLPPPRFSNPRSVRRARRALQALVEREKFDVVVCQALWAFAMFAPAARRAGAAVVLWARDRANRWHYIDRLASLTQPDLLIANSRYTAASIGDMFGVDSVVVQPRSLDV